MDNTPSTIGAYTPSTSSLGTPRKKGVNKKLIVIIAVVVFIALGTFLFLSRQGKKDEAGTDINTAEISPVEEPTTEPTEEVTETPEPTEEPTSTPKPTPATVVVAQDMRIQVQNGTGETGKAGEGVSFLKDKGYKSVEAANADREDYTNATVNIKASRKKFLDTLVSDLKGKYTVNEDTGTLDDGSDFDAVVIIGK